MLLLLCGLGDFLTTYISLGLGFSETRVFGFVPFLGTVLFAVVVWFVRRLNLPGHVKSVVCVYFVVFSFSGFANNFAGLLGVQSLTLLG